LLKKILYPSKVSAVTHIMTFLRSALQGTGVTFISYFVFCKNC